MVCCIILCVSNLLYSEAPCILCICIVKHPVSSDTCCATCILLYHCDQDNHCQVSTKVSKVSTAKCCVVWRAAITRLTYQPRTVLATFCRGGVTARPAARRSALRLFSVATYWMLGWCGGMGGGARGGQEFYCRSALGLAGQGPAEEAHGAAKDLAKDLAMWLVLHWVALGTPLKGQKTRWLYELG